MSLGGLRRDEIRGIPKRLRNYEQYVDACDDAADAIEELLTTIEDLRKQLDVKTRSFWSIDAARQQKQERIDELEGAVEELTVVARVNEERIQELEAENELLGRR